jgi:hypothetical protein
MMEPIKYLAPDLITIVSNLVILSRQFHTKKKTLSRIGPHNLDVVSILVGCLLGDAYSSLSKGKNNWY